jgi:hypothetical protein
LDLDIRGPSIQCSSLQETIPVALPQVLLKGTEILLEVCDWVELESCCWSLNDAADLWGVGLEGVLTGEDLQLLL